jgi:hypothetical protein
MLGKVMAIYKTTTTRRRKRKVKREEQNRTFREKEGRGKGVVGEWVFVSRDDIMGTDRLVDAHRLVFEGCR